MGHFIQGKSQKKPSMLVKNFFLDYQGLVNQVNQLCLKRVYDFKGVNE